jgi:hypothetical protein
VPATNTSVGEMNTLMTPADTDVVTELFLAHLPRFQAHARFAFHRVACPQTRADRIAGSLALAWTYFVTPSARGKRPETFAATLALWCTQAVKAGRKLVGCEGDRDAISSVAQVRHGFAVGRLPEAERAPGHQFPAELAESLADNTKSAVPEHAAFRLDFPRWRSTLRERDRAVLDALAAGEHP